MLSRYPSRSSGGQNNLSRLVAAAVVNRDFRDLLLSEPERALDEGYHGEKFPLDHAEKKLVTSIRASNLSDFALQLLAPQESQSHRGSGEWMPAKPVALALDAE